MSFLILTAAPLLFVPPLHTIQQFHTHNQPIWVCCGWFVGCWYCWWVCVCVYGLLWVWLCFPDQRVWTKSEPKLYFVDFQFHSLGFEADHLTIWTIFFTHRPAHHRHFPSNYQSPRCDCKQQEGEQKEQSVCRVFFWYVCWFLCVCCYVHYVNICVVVCCKRCCYLYNQHLLRQK